MIDVESYILAAKAAWILRLFTNTDAWTAIPVQSFEKLGLRFVDILRSNINDPKNIPNFLRLPLFYVDCILAFNKCKYNNCNITKDEILSECIWLS